MPLTVNYAMCGKRVTAVRLECLIKRGIKKQAAITLKVSGSRLRVDLCPPVSSIGNNCIFCNGSVFALLRVR